jgi:hypothetical protein
MMKNLKIYIAGAMSGHPNLNWDAFDNKQKQLEADGWDVVNPAAMTTKKLQVVILMHFVHVTPST